MTSAQLMPSVLMTALVVAGCARTPPLQPPVAMVSPYPHGQVWAVVPFANESGVSAVDTHRVADLFTQQLQQVRGVDTVPVNRVIFALRELRMQTVTSPGDATRLMNAMEVDGLIVGTVTAYDPYPPPKLGAAIQLFARRSERIGSGLDIRDLQNDPRGGTLRPGALGPAPAISQAAYVFDASNHQTLAWLNEYAAGRTEPDSAFGTDIYLMSIELFTEFVSYRLLHDLFAFEGSRQTALARQAIPR